MKWKGHLKTFEENWNTRPGATEDFPTVRTALIQSKYSFKGDCEISVNREILKIEQFQNFDFFKT